jgi:hypothetical protein
MTFFSLNKKSALKIILTLMFMGGLLLMAIPTFAAISFDSNSSSQEDNPTTNLSWSHTVGNGPSRILIVGLSIKDAVTANTVTYNVTSTLTRIDSQASPGSKNSVELWYLLSPPSGTANIDVTLSSIAKIVAGAISYSGVDQFTPLGPFVGNSGTNNLATATVSSAAGEIVFDTVSVEGQAPTTTAGAGQTEQWNRLTGSGGSDLVGGGSTEIGAASVTMYWSHASGRDWAIGTVSLKPKTIIPGSSGTVLFVTRSSAPSTDASELARINIIENDLGFEVNQIAAGATQAEYDTAIAASDVVYISERVQSNNVADKVNNACTGVVLEEEAMVDEFGLADGTKNYTSEQIYINNTSHYITQPFAGSGIGSYTIFTTAQSLHYLDSFASMAPSATVLAFQPTDSDKPVLATVEIGGLLNNSTNALGRRVFLPWMKSPSTAADFNSINANGRTILKRSLEWAMGENECSYIQKRSFLPDGTPLADGALIATGTEVKFLIYINNKGVALNDVSTQDILDPTFSYVDGTLQIDNSATECATNICTATEESNIFTAVNATSFITDSINGDGARFNGTNTIDAGDDTVPGNGTININANSVWALLFSVTLNN